jgi:hypothetical protein
MLAWTDDAFLREVAIYLVENGLSNVLMLGRVGDGDEAKDGLILVEKNFDGKSLMVSQCHCPFASHLRYAHE